MSLPDQPTADASAPDASDAWLTLDDLCTMTDETRRTVRFYILNGLLSAPVGAGPAARYPRAHVARLRLVRRLQAEGMQLSRIRDLLETERDTEIATWTSRLVPVPAAQPDPRQMHAGEAPTQPSQSGLTRSQWEHIVLEPGVELHVRRPLGVSANRRVQRLLEYVQKISSVHGADARSPSTHTSHGGHE